MDGPAIAVLFVVWHRLLSPSNQQPQTAQRQQRKRRRFGNRRAIAEKLLWTIRTKVDRGVNDHVSELRRLSQKSAIAQGQCGSGSH